MISDLIYDVGMHDGSDTAYYLSKGFRVVAIEANPALVEKAACRFSAAIATDRLTIVNVAITPKAGPVDFWVSDKNEGWSSLDRRAADRQDGRSESLTVDGKRFADILAEYGVPYYAKIDIELADHYCLAAINPDERPLYLSVEAGSIDVLCELHRLGYNAFKIIDQNRHNDRYRVRHKERLLDRLRLASDHRSLDDTALQGAAAARSRSPEARCRLDSARPVRSIRPLRRGNAWTMATNRAPLMST